MEAILAPHKVYNSAHLIKHYDFYDLYTFSKFLNPYRLIDNLEDDNILQKTLVDEISIYKAIYGIMSSCLRIVSTMMKNITPNYADNIEVNQLTKKRNKIYHYIKALAQEEAYLRRKGNKWHEGESENEEDEEEEDEVEEGNIVGKNWNKEAITLVNCETVDFITDNVNYKYIKTEL